MRKNLRIYISLVAVLLVFAACRQAKYVPQGEYLLKSNEIVFMEGGDSGWVEKEEQAHLDEGDMLDFVRPVPNKGFKLWVYNRFDTTRFNKKVEKREAKFERKNEKRRLKEGRINKERIEAARAEGDSVYKHKTIKPKEVKYGLKYAIRTKLGQEPVSVDTAKMVKVRKQLEIYLHKNGFFSGEVRDTVLYKEKKRKGYVQYHVHAGEPYVIRTIDFDTVPEIKELILMYDRYRKKRGTLVNVGDVYSESTLDDERDRYSAYCRDQGAYFDFNKNYINFRVDTTVGDHDVAIQIYIKDRMIALDPNVPDSLTKIRHQKYKVSKVEFRLHNPDTVSFKDFEAFKRRCDALGLPYKTDGRYTLLDTIDLGARGVYLYNEKPWIRPEIVDFQNFLEIGHWYKDYYVDRTYRTMNKLDIFSKIQPRIQVDPANPKGRFVHVRYDLEPHKRQAFMMEPRTYNTNGALGLNATVTYSNRNIFRRAIRLKISITGGLEAQPAIVSVSDSVWQTLTAWQRTQQVINTVEFGPVVNISFPNLFPIPNAVLAGNKRLYPSTEIHTALNFQQRIEFTRRLGEFSHVWKFKNGKTKEWRLNLINFKYVQMDIKPILEATLADLDDPELLNSYSDHFTTLIAAGFSYNNQNSDKRKRPHIHDVKFDATSSGILVDLWGIGKNAPVEVGDTSLRSFLGIPYTQFLRGDFQYIYNHSITKKTKLVYRFLAGVGYAYRNSPSLPYEQSFFAGGSNDIRAFVAKSMAPGGLRKYEDPNLTQTQIADMRLEMNLELRFPLSGMFAGAVFFDAGNIWNIPDKNTVDGDPTVFQFNTFGKQIAVGTGFGLRADLDFLVVRLDAAFPVYNPYLPPGERFLFDEKDTFRAYFDENENIPYPRPHFPRLNLGIGYPF